MLELHCHTTCSDGSLTPTELVEAAAIAGVKALAISDHDTLLGWDEAMIAGDRLGVEIVPALELSTVWCGRSLHILGFYPDRDKLEEPLQERQQGRVRRAQLIIQKLGDLGYPVTLPPALKAPGRPHIAQAMVEAGYVRCSQEAFERFLKDDGPAYVAYEKFSAIEGIQLLRQCGAIPVWAHPHLFRGETVERTLRSLVSAGLLGIEVYHPDQNRSVVSTLLNLAKKYDLLITGGSDYHGPNARGCYLNMMNLSLQLLDDVKQRHQLINRQPCTS